MDKDEVGAALIGSGLVTEQDVDNATERQAETGESLIDALVDDSALDEASLVRAMADYMGLDYVNLADAVVDPAAVALVPDSLARRATVIPIGFEGEDLVLAMADPANVLVIDDVRALTGRRVIVRVASRSDIQAALGWHHHDEPDDFDIAELVPGDADLEDLGAIEAAVEEAPVVKLVSTLITRAVNERASDIHVEPGAKDLRIRFRIDGVLHEVMTTPRSVANAVVSRLKIMGDLDIAERRVPQDGRISIRAAGRAIDLRVATLPGIYGEKVVLRILDTADTVLNLPDLGFLPHTLEPFERSFRRPHGLILVTGPTGSGKTTTLYAALEQLNSAEKNIITVEDPVEYRLAGVNQVQVNRKAGLLFATALKSILRSDPDIILIGEVRDVETAKIAVESALTGHLVLSTLHTNDAASSIGRLIDMGVEPFLVSSALDSVLAQRLARKLCDRCKTPQDVTQEVAKDIGIGPYYGRAAIFGAVGCSMCSGTGYSGRIAINEVMVVTEEIQHMAVDHRRSDEIKAKAIEQGMVTLRVDGMEKVKLGLTSLEEVLRVVS
ncbi:MAG TPA: ATPase, T2SS/T4P/T4SS family [Acidimicrobiia bacterium]|nr:ATPase, T2SS/T4P/T4SS family [Acidimicrobiia bacterium]